jgi:exodeoxyribonuclease V beta subunit
MKGRENFDTKYAGIMDLRKTLEAKDRMNILYVALTRAVEGLIVVRKPKDSMFDVLNMETLRLGALKPPSATSQKKSDASVSGEEITLSHYGTQERIKSLEEDKDYEAILFGTALHYALEMLGDFSIEALGTAQTALQNRFGQHLSAPKIKEIMLRIECLLREEKFQTVLKNAKIHKEKSLSFEGELKQIDLLLEYPEEMLVIEYKSSQKYKMKHQQQVAYYKKAIEGITHKPTRGIVIYILKDKILLEEI